MGNKKPRSVESLNFMDIIYEKERKKKVKITKMNLFYSFN